MIFIARLLQSAGLTACTSQNRKESSRCVQKLVYAFMYSSQPSATVTRHENHDRYGRMVSADQRRGKHIGSNRRVARPLGHEVRMLTPRNFRSVACPTYPEIRLSLLPRKALQCAIAAFVPQALHIATEGPLGLAIRAHQGP